MRIQKKQSLSYTERERKREREREGGGAGIQETDRQTGDRQTGLTTFIVVPVHGERKPAD